MTQSSRTNYELAAKEAGYDTSEDNVSFVYETPDSFLIVCEDNNEETWLVGEFIKKTINHSGDYTGVPRFEGSKEAATKYVKRVMIEHISDRLIEMDPLQLEILARQQY